MFHHFIVNILIVFCRITLEEGEVEEGPEEGEEGLEEGECTPTQTTQLTQTQVPKSAQKCQKIANKVRGKCP